MLLEAIPLLFSIFHIRFFRSKVLNCCRIFPGCRLYSTWSFFCLLSPRTADPPLFFQENSFLHLPHPPVLPSLRQKICCPPTFSSGFFFHHTVFRACRKAADNSAAPRKTSDLFSATSGGTSCRQHLSPAFPPSPLPLSQTSDTNFVYSGKRSVNSSSSLSGGR